LEEDERFPHLIRAVLARPWAIDEESVAWAAICDVLALRAAGGALTDGEIQARIDAAAVGPRAGGGRDGAVAVVPLYGVISPRMNLMSAMSGGTTAEGFVRSFRAALADPDVTGILIDVDSPGGNVQGITEAAAVVREARGRKPIVAIANHDAYSAAYWIASQADEVVVSPSGGVGSIGIIGGHQDISEAQAKAGVKTTLISAGKYKTEGNPYEPLGDEARAEMQRRADAFMAIFAGDVAKGRGTTVAGPERLRPGPDRLGKGRCRRRGHGRPHRHLRKHGPPARRGPGQERRRNVPASEPTDDTEAAADEAPLAAEADGHPSPTHHAGARRGPARPARAPSGRARARLRNRLIPAREKESSTVFDVSDSGSRAQGA
jgi:signal peptide peptidase SppA